MIFDLVQKGHEGTSLFPIHTSYTESYAEEVCRLYLTDELEKDRTGHGGVLRVPCCECNIVLWHDEIN